MDDFGDSLLVNPNHLPDEVNETVHNLLHITYPLAHFFAKEHSIKSSFWTSNFRTKERIHEYSHFYNAIETSHCHDI